MGSLEATGCQEPSAGGGERPAQEQGAERMGVRGIHTGIGHRDRLTLWARAAQRCQVHASGRSKGALLGFPRLPGCLPGNLKPREATRDLLRFPQSVENLLMPSCPLGEHGSSSQKAPQNPPSSTATFEGKWTLLPNPHFSLSLARPFQGFLRDSEHLCNSRVFPSPI